MKKLVIFGAGDIARLAQFYFSVDAGRDIACFAVDEAYLPQSGQLNGLPVIPFEKIEETHPPDRHDMFIALSYARMNSLRKEKYLAAKQKGYALASYVSSKCTYLAQQQPGDNCFILEDNTIQPFARIGSNVTLWSGNHIGHDSVIKDHCFITSHVVVSGNVVVDEQCFIGVNATLRNSINIAPRTLIGAGAVIMKNTQPDEVYLPERAKLFDKKSFEIEL